MLLNLGLGALSVSGSIVIVNSTTIQLDGDVVAPGNSYFYGTSSSGIKGFYTIASGAVSSITGTIGNVLVNGGTTAATGAITLSLPTALTSINSITAAASTDLVLNVGSGQTQRLLIYQNSVQAGWLQYGPHSTSSTGTGNTFFGVAAGKSIDVSVGAYNNALFGANCGQALTQGYQNTFIGSSSGDQTTTGHANTFLGQGSGYSNITEHDSVGVGFHSALNVAGGGGQNTAIGASALAGDNAGAAAGYNTAVGYMSMFAPTTASQNTGVGRYSGFSLTTGSTNTFIGNQAGFSVATGNGNVMLGRYSGAYETGSNAFYIDNQDRTNTAGDKTSALLYGTFNATPASQTLLVNATLTLLGSLSSVASTDLVINVGAGQTQRLLIYQNTVLAGWLQYGPHGSSSTGTGNTFFGVAAGQAINTGTNAYNNALFGANAGQAITTGYQNTFIGSSTGDQTTTGHANTFVGQGAGYNNTTESDSVGIGFHAITNPVGGGGQNTAIGSGALGGDAASTAAYNTAIGYQSLNLVTSASENVAVGRYSGYSLTTGIRNTFIGPQAGYSVSTGGSNVMIGRYAGAYETASNAFYIDNQDRTNTAGDKAKALLYGTFNATALSQTLVANVGTFTVLGNSISGAGVGWGVASTVTTAAITTLTSSSTAVQIFTGGTTQTVQLPAANAMGSGVSITYHIVNKSSSGISIKAAGSDLIEGVNTYSLMAGGRVCIIGDASSAWSVI